MRALRSFYEASAKFGEARARLLRGSRQRGLRGPILCVCEALAKILRAPCEGSERLLRGSFEVPCEAPAKPQRGFLRGPFEASARIGDVPTKPVHGFCE